MHIAGSGTDVAVEAADVVLIRFVYFDVVSSIKNPMSLVSFQTNSSPGMTYLMWWPALISQRRLWTESTWTSYSPASTISLESPLQLGSSLLLVWRCNHGWVLQPWPSRASPWSAPLCSWNFIASQREKSLRRRSTTRPWSYSSTNCIFITIWTRPVESESLKVRKSLKIGKNWIKSEKSEFIIY